jgi:hypothetical protein
VKAPASWSAASQRRYGTPPGRGRCVILGFVLPSWPAWLLILAVATASFSAQAITATNAPSADKVPSTRDLDPFRATVQTLRGKKFLRPVPAFTISERELRSVIESEVEKDYPGGELADYEALMIWLDVLPPGTDLKAASAAFAVDQVAGLYDSDTKEMYIPSFSTVKTNVPKAAAKKEAEKFSSFSDGIVLDHEFTHALEDQYWPLDDTNQAALHESTDRSTARSFLAEGAATRIMIEAVPAQLEEEVPGLYPTAWNVIHSGLMELVFNLTLKHVWKSPDVQVPGVPQALACSEAMPYAYGYTFCTALMRNWGLDGLDYICDHQPASTEQIIHPQKAWEWRDLPVQITLPATPPNGWKELTGESLGEAGVSVLFGCAFKNLNRGERLAYGWDGDRAGLYQAPNGGRLLVWASSWDSEAAASRFASTWVKERQKLHQANVTRKERNHIEWAQPDGHAGVLAQNDKQVVIFESDKPEGLADLAAWTQAITFTQPPEDAARAAANHALWRFNPLFSWQKDADYTVSQTLWGILSRHDRNSVGAADRVALGLLGDWHRTASFTKWQLGWSLVAKHQSDTRRGVYKTALLPWGVLFGQFSAKLPQDPARSLSRVSLLWGLAASCSKDSIDRTTFNLLPAGILFRTQTSPSRTAVHVLGTGASRSHPTSARGATTRYRLFGIPVWTSRPTELRSPK